MSVTRYADSRRTETPNAVMTTLASPTQGGAAQALWRVDMAPGQVGPPHALDSEQVWTLLNGGATIELGGESLTLTSGDTIVMPADVLRRVYSDTETGFTAIVTAPATARVYTPSEDVTIAPGCAVADGDKILPAWMA